MVRTKILGVDAEVAKSFRERAKGLIGFKSLPLGKGMLITKCNAIHTCFMKFPIDAIFLDDELKVVKVIKNIRPWRLLVWGGWRARSVLEIACDTLKLVDPAGLEPTT